MTFGSPYATIHEAWGTESLKVEAVMDEKKDEHQKDKEKKKPQPPPPPPHHSAKEEQFDNIMDRYDFDDRFHAYEKKKNRSTRLAKPHTESHTDPAAFPVIVEDFMGSAMDPERQYLNFALYVFSGVVLIFVMEQFIQIGLSIRGSR
jgi:hypothetical protein